MMADDKLAELLKTQKSLTEWLQDIRHGEVEALRHEDNEKRERLKVLNKTIDLPFDRPTQFEAQALAEESKELQTYLKEHGDELCALRLIPKQSGLPKLRMRGKTVRDAFAWFKEQDIEPSKYRADFIPHAEDSSWATIFIVNQYGIQGEIIFGGHHQLTQGFHDKEAPITFRFDFNKWHLQPANKAALAHLKQLAGYLHVSDKRQQHSLHKALGATFNHDYLEGYFETTDSELGTWFIDYSPVLGNMYADFQIKTASHNPAALVSGQIGSAGTAKGPVRIISLDNLDNDDFPAGSVLVCKVTTPKFVPLMEKAVAIVTDQGGILSHAAIVARELKKPCIVATGNATEKLKNGQGVFVNADAGLVQSL
jgi:phosphohistidine swiveling domain-containing protein